MLQLPFQIVTFAARRLFYAGELQQKSLAGAFCLASGAASRRMSVLRDQFADFIDHDKPRKLVCVKPNELQQKYPCVNGNAILNELRARPGPSRNQLGFPMIDAQHRGGAMWNDGAFVAPTFDEPQTALRVPDEIDYTSLLFALCRSQAVGINYVKMNLDDQPRDRIVYPMYLRLLGDHLAVSCYDYEALRHYSCGPPPPLKTFVLFRILFVESLYQSAEYRRVTNVINDLTYGRELIRPYRVILNNQYSESQRLVMSRELGLDHLGRKFMDSATLFFFKARFCGAVSPDNQQGSPGSLIWPPVVGVELT
jgi:hypothetical protein